MEVERKWLMNDFPAGEQVELMYEVEQRQSYISTTPVVRIRSEKITFGSGAGQQRFVLCVKGKGRLARDEIETPVSAETCAALMDFCQAPPIVKRNRHYRLPDGKVLECSLVDENTQGAFFYAEIEFASVEEAKAYTPPAFLGAEKTYDPTFSMSRLWLRHVAGFTTLQTKNEAAL